MKNFKPYTQTRRHAVLINRENLWKGSSEKSLTKKYTAKAGRNNSGRITSRHRGGGHKKKFRIIDFKRQKFDIPATVIRIEYDPIRTAHIALIEYEDKTKSYIIAPDKLKIGDKVQSGEKVDIRTGNSLPLKNIPVGTVLHNIEMKPGKGAQIARSAGSSVNLLAIDSGKAIIKLNSGEIKNVNENCFATIGTVSNLENKNIKIGSAGRKRWLGFRPKVRGVAMNPIDHPHGGGEGRTSGGRHPSTPWGKPTKGFKTRKNKKTDKSIVRSRRKK
ncbi:MAG: 50S ribosomal protein L2 [Alphaproteobacteria bacterium MarineAlpha6_Bin6]|nr:MAG: 50S ribosomal protein L2 [Alphaproteobacteria bacterium MarineAlpha6_Bin6]PPR32666.1 MAG: 50S ribosomal protein L2 [Alphaproteobacteria bacterium MarineAlpha6_Bin5]|tara:strand:+ start:622 stop:1443 length:822 start_codon:yes stop_codon:yes gene_type:complete